MWGPMFGGGLGVLCCGAPMVKDVPVTGMPSISMVPAVRVTSAPIMLRIVDLPHPDGPTIATNSLS